MTYYNIGQVSKMSGLSTKTIRFYETTEVIKPYKRSSNGYRIYSDNEIGNLRLIKQVREMGLPLSEIKKLLLGCATGKCCHSQDETIMNLKTYLSMLDAQINNLIVLKKRLSILKKTIGNQNPNGQYCCDLLHQLANIPIKEVS